MESQKIENLLNLALQSTSYEREKSQELTEGYSPSTNSWELIIKYHGELENLRSMNILVEPLINGYCIVTIREDLIPALASLNQVEYIEMPKRLFFA